MRARGRGGVIPAINRDAASGIQSELPGVVPITGIAAVTVTVAAAAVRAIVPIVHSTAIPLVTHHRVIAHHVAA